MRDSILSTTEKPKKKTRIVSICQEKENFLDDIKTQSIKQLKANGKENFCNAYVITQAYLESGALEEARHFEKEIKEYCLAKVEKPWFCLVYASYAVSAGMQWSKYFYKFPDKLINDYLLPLTIECALEHFNYAALLLAKVDSESSETKKLKQALQEALKLLTIQLYYAVLLPFWQTQQKSLENFDYQRAANWCHYFEECVKCLGLNELERISALHWEKDRKLHPVWENYIKLLSGTWHRAAANDANLLLKLLKEKETFLQCCEQRQAYLLARAYYHSMVNILRIAEKHHPTRKDLVSYRENLNQPMNEVIKKIQKNKLENLFPCLEQQKDFTRDYRQKLTALRDAFQQQLIITDNVSIFKIQKKLSEDLCGFLNEMLGDIHGWLGEAPCEFNVLVGGSLARKQAGPYSDVDSIFLIDKEEARQDPYFKAFIQLWYGQLKLLCEPNGLHLDDGDIGYLLGEEQRLLNTPEGLVATYDPKKVSQEYSSEFYAQQHTRSLYASRDGKKLLDRYHNLLQASYQGVEQGRPLYCPVGMKFLEWHTEQFQAETRKSLHQGELDIKKRFLAPLLFWCYDLGLYFGISAVTAQEVLPELRRFVKPTFLERMEEALTFLQRLRLQTHLAMGWQCDKLIRRPVLTDSDAYGISDEDYQQLEKIEQYLLFLAYISISSLSTFKEERFDPLLCVLKQWDNNRALILLLGLAWHLSRSSTDLREHLHYYELLPSKVRAEYLRILESAEKNSASISAITRSLARYPTLNGERASQRIGEQKWQALLDRLTCSFPEEEKEKNWIISPILGFRQLHPEIIKQLRKWLTPEGKLNWQKQSAHPGNHLVIPIQRKIGNQIFSVHLKICPELPLVSVALHKLYQLLMGGGTPPLDLWLWHIEGDKNYLVLVSQTVIGKSLQQLLDESPEKLTLLSLYDYSWRFLMTLLTNPEDDKPDNEIVETFEDDEGQTRIRFIAIDTDRAFVTPFGERGVRVKTVIYCCDEMSQPIHPEVRSEFLRFDPLELLTKWLTSFGEMNQKYYGLFFPHIEEFFERSGQKTPENQRSCLLVPFNRQVLSEMFAKFQRIQEMLLKNPRITHQELLNAIHPRLGTHYQEFRKETSLKVRFKRATEGQYEVDKTAHNNESHTTILDLETNLKSMYGNIPARDKLKDLWENDCAQLKQELEELRQWDKSIEQARVELLKGNMEPFSQLAHPFLQSHVLRKVICQLEWRKVEWQEEANKGLQEAIVKACIGIAWSRFKFPDCQAMTDDDLEKLLKKASEIKSLRIRGASLGENWLRKITQRAPYIKTLDLSYTNVIIKIEKKKKSRITIPGVRYKLELPPSLLHLRYLNLEQCPKIEILVLDVPQLQELSLAGCKNLTKIRLIKTRLLHHLNIIDCTALTFAGLLECVPEADRLQKIKTNIVMVLILKEKAKALLKRSQKNNLSSKDSNELECLLKFFEKTPEEILEEDDYDARRTSLSPVYCRDMLIRYPFLLSFPLITIKILYSLLKEMEFPEVLTTQKLFLACGAWLLNAKKAKSQYRVTKALMSLGTPDAYKILFYFALEMTIPPDIRNIVIAELLTAAKKNINIIAMLLLVLEDAEDKVQFQWKNSEVACAEAARLLGELGNTDVIIFNALEKAQESTNVLIRQQATHALRKLFTAKFLSKISQDPKLTSVPTRIPVVLTGYYNLQKKIVYKSTSLVVDIAKASCYEKRISYKNWDFFFEMQITASEKEFISRLKENSREREIIVFCFNLSSDENVFKSIGDYLLQLSEIKKITITELPIFFVYECDSHFEFSEEIKQLKQLLSDFTFLSFNRGEGVQGIIGQCIEKYLYLQPSFSEYLREYQRVQLAVKKGSLSKGTSTPRKNNPLREAMNEMRTSLGAKKLNMHHILALTLTSSRKKTVARNRITNCEENPSRMPSISILGAFKYFADSHGIDCLAFNKETGKGVTDVVKKCIDVYKSIYGLKDENNKEINLMFLSDDDADKQIVSWLCKHRPYDEYFDRECDLFRKSILFLYEDSVNNFWPYVINFEIISSSVTYFGASLKENSRFSYRDIVMVFGFGTIEGGITLKRAQRYLTWISEIRNRNGIKVSKSSSVKKLPLVFAYHETIMPQVGNTKSHDIRYPSLFSAKKVVSKTVVNNAEVSEIKKIKAAHDLEPLLPPLPSKGGPLIPMPLQSTQLLQASNFDNALISEQLRFTIFGSTATAILDEALKSSDTEEEEIEKEKIEITQEFGAESGVQIQSSEDSMYALIQLLDQTDLNITTRFKENSSFSG